MTLRSIILVIFALSVIAAIGIVLGPGKMLWQDAPLKPAQQALTWTTTVTQDLVTINAYRKMHNVPPLVLNNTLATVAQQVAEALVSEKVPSSRDFASDTIYNAAEHAGYKSVRLGHVGALGYESFDEAFAATKGSSLDSAILLDPLYIDAGIGKVNNPASQHKTGFVIVLAKPKS